jgi:hypothetical protein
MADNITTNADLIAFSIFVDNDLERLVGADESEFDTIWLNIHKTAWQNFVLPDIKAMHGVAEDDISDTSNLKVLTALKVAFLALDSRGKMAGPDSKDAMRKADFDRRYKSTLRSVEIRQSGDDIAPSTTTMQTMRTG